MLLKKITKRNTWDALLSTCSKGALSQSWQYGQGMAGAEGWTPGRWAIVDGDTPIAAVQIFTRRFKGVVPVARIQRGPLYVRDAALSLEQKLDVLRFLIAYWKEKHHVLYISPSLTTEECDAERLAPLGLKPGGERAWWGTIRVNTALPLDQLRANMRPTWRRNLRLGEGLLSATHACSWQGYQDFLRQHLPFMKRRNIQWPSRALIHSMLDQDAKEGRVFTISLRHDCREAGGVLNIVFGDTCYGFLGWSIPEARKMGANHFAVWETLKFAKEYGARWFDFGGIDEKRYPGITSYKRGVRGQEHDLVGAFYADHDNPVLKHMITLADWRRKHGSVRNMLFQFLPTGARVRFPK